MDNQTLSLIITNRYPAENIDSFSEEEWNLLAGKAHTEGVAPLVYWAFSQSQSLSKVPPSIRNHLRGAYAGTWMHNQRTFKEAETLLRLFDQAGLAVVALKGICFALTIYPDIGLRPMGDVDLLVRSEHLDSAVTIARSCGYQDYAPEASPGLKDLLTHHVCLQKQELPATVLEIHDRLVGEEAFSFSVPMDWFWEQTEPLPSHSSLQAEHLLMLTPAAQILYASAHAMLQHGGKNAPLRWFCDLDHLLRHYGGCVDWNLLLAQAKTFEWGSALEAALIQTKNYFDTPIPDPVLADLATHSDRHRSLVAQKQVRPPTHILEEQQKLLSLNWYGRFRLVMALAFPTPAYMRWRYQLKNSWLLFIYYPFRWWGILADAVHTLSHLVKRTSARS